jgi:hypothetical protein
MNWWRREIYSKQNDERGGRWARSLSAWSGGGGGGFSQSKRSEEEGLLKANVVNEVDDDVSADD